MPHQTPPYPEYPAVRAYIDALGGGHREFAELLDIDERTASRIFSGKIKPGRSLLAEILANAQGAGYA